MLETTIHESDVGIIITREDAYSGKYGIRYDKYAEFNDMEYREYKSILAFMQFFGKGRRVIRNMESRKQKFIWNIYKEITPLIKSVIRR